MGVFRLRTFGEGGSSHLLTQGGVDLIRWMLFCQVVVSSLAQSNAPGHLGCFVDEGNRALKGGSTNFNSLSVQRCFKYCQDDLLVEYKYAGLEYQEECYCGNNDNYRKHGPAKESACQKYRCTGNSDQFCGGDWRIAIYKVSLGACSNAIGPPARGTNSVANPPGLSYNLDNYKFLGTTVKFDCDAGNVLDGSPAIECIQNGNTVSWNDSVPTCTAIVPTTVPTTTTMSATTTSAPTTDRTTATPMSRATTRAPPSSTDAASKKDQHTFGLDKVSLIGIVIGALAAVIIGLAFIIFICRKRKRKASTAFSMDTMGMHFSNNMYETTIQPTQGDADVAPGPNQEYPTAPLYSEVTLKQSRSDEGAVYSGADSTADYVNTVIRPSEGDLENGRSGLVDNILYEIAPFRDE